MKQPPSHDQQKWQVAMQKEHENLQALDTCELVLLVKILLGIHSEIMSRAPEKAGLCVRGDQEENNF